MRQQEWADLEGENAFAVMGVVGGCLRRLARESGNPAMEGIDDRYRTEAMDGDYEHLMDMSHRYAFEHLRETLRVPEDRPWHLRPFRRGERADGSGQAPVEDLPERGLRAEVGTLMSRNKQSAKTGRRERHPARQAALREAKKRRKARAARFAHLPGQQATHGSDRVALAKGGKFPPRKLNERTMPELRGIAADAGCEVRSRHRKAEVIAMIEAKYEAIR